MASGPAAGPAPARWSPADFTMNGPAYLEDPYPFYRFMREHHPVHRSGMYGGSWLVFRYADVAELAVSDALTNQRAHLPVLALPDATPADDRLARTLSPWVAFLDDEDHRRQRRHLAALWNTVSMADLERHVRTAAAGLLAGTQTRARLDLMEEFARPLAAAAIARMLGLPAGEHRRLGGLADDIAFLFGSSEIVRGDLDAAERSAAALLEFFDRTIGAMSGPPRHSMLARMTEAGPDGHRYSVREAATQCILLLFAGLTPVRHLVASAFTALDARPAARAALAARPDLLPTAVEELLRFDTPVQNIARVCRTPFEFRGHRIRAGEPVLLYAASANRDPAVFDDPDRLVLDRRPHRHLSFGHGPHYCLAGAMVRRTLAAVLPTLLRLLDRFTVDRDGVVHNRALGFHGFETLPVIRYAT